MDCFTTYKRNSCNIARFTLPPIMFLESLFEWITFVSLGPSGNIQNWLFCFGYIEINKIVLLHVTMLYTCFKALKLNLLRFSRNYFTRMPFLSLRYIVQIHRDHTFSTCKWSLKIKCTRVLEMFIDVSVSSYASQLIRIKYFSYKVNVLGSHSTSWLTL